MRVTLLACLITLIQATTAFAGGLYVNEFATASQANAGAGRGAWTPDASAVLHNPAAMTRFDDHAFATGIAAAFGVVEFDPDSSSPSGTKDGGNQAGFAPLASSSYVHKVSDRVRFGLSFFSLSGSILNPKNDWAGRFELEEISLLTISFAPNIAFQVTDWLSIGGGPIATYGMLDWDLKVALPGPGARETELKLDKLDDWEPAGRVGILLHPSEQVAVSITWQSKVDFNLKGSIDLPNGIGTSLDTELPLAQVVEVSAYWQTSERLALLAIFNWEDWSAADELAVEVGGLSVDAVTGFRDTFKVGLGANILISDDWLVQTGITFDTSGLKDSDRTTALPVDSQIRAAIGARYQLKPSTALGFSFVYVNLGQGDVSNAVVSGDYERNHAFVFGLTLDFSELWWAGRGTI